MAGAKVALSVLAHPDDAELMCAGTLALLKDKGWQIHIATMTPGDCGSAEYNREEISKIRRVEAAKAAAILNGTYHCLECDDVFILYDRQTLLKAIELMRQVKPTVVFTASPSDYMIDHEMASKVTQTACFSAGMMNIKTKTSVMVEPVPHLYYVDAMEAKDILGNPIVPTTIVDIGSTIDTKEKMLCCHASQRNWLLAHHGIDEYVISMKNFAQNRGTLIKRKYAEGFRQHLGHAYPHDDILKTELGNLVHTSRKE